MKKVILIAMACFAIITCQSQTEKGKMFIGGLINFSDGNTSYYDTSGLTGTSKNYHFQITPNYGYFIKDNFAIGVNLNYLTQSTTNDNTNNSAANINYTQTKNIYGAGVFARYYKKLIGNFMFIANGSIAYNYEVDGETGISDPINENNKINSFNVTITPGLVYFISPKFGLETTFGNLNYSYSSTKNNDTSSQSKINTSNFGLNLDFSAFSFGVNYYF